jgi:hypothetical protein
MSLTGRTGVLVPASAISDIPNSLLSKRQMKAMNSRNQIIELSASNGASQNDSGVISFNVGCGAGQGYMKAGSAYLQFEFTPTSTANSAFNGETASCANIIRSLNINVGGLQVEMINDYKEYYRIIQAHACNANYVERDASITEKGTAMVSGAPLTFCVPLASGLLQQDNHIPLWLFNSQLQVQLNLASAAEALYVAGGTASAYTINNPVLIYEKIFCDADFENAVRQKLAQGGLYELPFVSAMSYRSASAASNTFSQNIGVNLSSLSGCLWGHVATADVANSAAKKSFVMANVNTRGTSNRVVRCDGSQLIQSQVYSEKTSFMELQRTLGAINDVNQTTVATASNWTTEYFTNGQSAERFSDADLTMRGRACNNLVIEEVGRDATATTVYVYLVYTGVLIVSGDGSAVVSK